MGPLQYWLCDSHLAVVSALTVVVVSVATVSNCTVLRRALPQHFIMVMIEDNIHYHCIHKATTSKCQVCLLGPIIFHECFTVLFIIAAEVLELISHGDVPVPFFRVGPLVCVGSEETN
jgi:hypothetical protein